MGVFACHGAGSWGCFWRRKNRSIVLVLSGTGSEFKGIEHGLRILLIALTFGIFLAPGKSWSLDLFKDTKPQSTGVSCQSYAAILALAGKGDPAFPVDSFDELRSLEGEFRNLAAQHGDPLNHSTWPQAMSDLTAGKYTLKISYPTDDVIEWLEAVRGSTRIDTSADVLIQQLTGQNFDVVLTSVSDIGGSHYQTGHIVAVLGVIGSGIDSTTRLVAFNSAIKGTSGTGVMCNDGTAPGDAKYQAGVIDTNNFTLKGFPKFLLMTLVEQ